MASDASDAEKRAYIEAIRRHVCSVCLDSRDDGSCSLTGRVCAIEAHLPRLVEAILGTSSPRMDDYVDTVRAQICSRCLHEDQARRCALRDAGDCALETYLPLVVDAIESIDRSALVEDGGR